MVVVLVAAILMTRVAHLLPGGRRTRRVPLRVHGRLRAQHRRPAARLCPAVHRLLHPHPVLELERPGPPVGRIEQLRAPTSDVNVTIGLALVSFLYFEFQGFRRLGVGGYLGKFFPLYEFRKRDRGHRPLRRPGRAHARVRQAGHAVDATLRQHLRRRGRPRRDHALTIAFIPVALLGLEVMLNAIQALIFSVLTLIFITLAIESHEQEGHVAEDATPSTARGASSSRPH